MRRRTFLLRSACGAAALVAPGCRAAERRANEEAAPSPRPRQPAAAAKNLDPMDDALARLSSFGPGGGNHAPMGAEALIALGRGDLARRWVEGYIERERMMPRPAGEPIDASGSTAALGRKERIGDWMATFRAEITAGRWPDVLRRWLPILLPGLAGAATHGIIRTAHAVRSLERSDTVLRRNELADGLGYWAAYYQPMGELAAPSVMLPSAGLAKVPLTAAASRQRRMIPSLRARARDKAFTTVTAAVAAESGSEPAFLSDLTRVFAGIYSVAGAATPIPFIHAITGPAALRLLWSYLETESRGRAVRFAWQTAAGLWSSFAPSPLADIDEPAAVASDEGWRAALETAVAHGDVHVIKLAEACHREAAITDDGRAYLAAARAVATHL